MRVLLFLLLPLTVFSQKDRTALLDSFMKAEMSHRKFNGNILIAKDGKILYQKAFGFRNYSTGEKLNNQSVFELASISKQFTAMGILMLVEKGRLSLTDSLRNFFPQLPYQHITIRNLLTHTSGLPDYEEAMGPKWDHKKVAFNKDVIEFLATEKIPLRFKPGSRWEYSNTAYAILASIIEQVSNQSFRDYMQQYVFSPLNMTASRVYNTRRSTGERIPNYAYGFVYSDSLKKYVLPDSVPELNFVYYLDGIQGDGIINTTTGDLLKWDRALKHHTLLRETMQKEMLSPQSTMDTLNEKYYGYGVIIGENEIGQYIMHTGGWPGYHTAYFRYLKDDLTIIVLSNNESYSSLLSGALAYIVHGRPMVFPKEHKAAAADTAFQKRFIGKYRIPSVPIPAVIDIYEKEGKLVFKFEKGSRVRELIPESKGSFFVIDDQDIQIDFKMGADGNVEKAYYTMYSMKKEMTKLN